MIACIGLSFFLLFVVFFGHFRIKEKCEKYIRIEDVFCLAFMIVLMGGRTTGPDWEVYEHIYRIDLFTKDIGFGYFILLCKKLGFTLYQTRLFIAFVGITLIYITARKFLDRRYIKWFYLFYFICPYFLDSIQLRNFLGMSIFIFATPLLLENNLKNSIKFLLLIIVAGLMQKTCFIYIFCVFIKKIDRIKFLKYVGTLMLVASVLVGVNKSIVAGIGNMLLSLISDSLEGVASFLTISTNYGWIIPWSETALSIMSIWLINKYVSFSINIDTRDKKIVEITYLMNLATIAVFPLYVLSTNFFRIGRNLQVLNVIVFCVFLKNLKSNRISIKKDKKYLVVGLIAIQMLYLSYWTLLSGYWDSIIVTAFADNWILGG